MNCNSLELFCTNLINFLTSQPEIGDFVSPVQWKKLKLDDYPKVIKTPMSIAVIKRKFNFMKYQTKKEIIDDVNLIWSNCRQYNASGSEIVKRADILSQLFNDFLKKKNPGLPAKRKTLSDAEDSSENEKPMKKNKLKESEDQEESFYYDHRFVAPKTSTRRTVKSKEKSKNVSRQASKSKPKPLKRSKSEKSESLSKNSGKKVLKQQKLTVKREEKAVKNVKPLKTEEDSQDFESVSSVKSSPGPCPASNHKILEEDGDSSIKEEPTSLNCISLNEDSEKGSILTFKDVSVEKLIKLKEKIRETSMEKLCKVLRFIKKRNPDSISQNDEKVMIALEKLTYQTFHDVWSLVVGDEEALESNEDQ